MIQVNIDPNYPKYTIFHTTFVYHGKHVIIL